MVTRDKITAATKILVEAAKPERVILFGSYARGTERPDSDVDLLVIEREIPDRIAEIARLRRLLSPLRIPVDVLVATTDQVRSSWADFPGSYLYDALREGKVLYDVDRPGAAASS